MQFDVNYSKLKNGVRVLTVPMAGVESVTAMILCKTGSRNETLPQAGISHVLEHMVFKGTTKYPSPMAIAEAVDSIGAEQNAFTSKEYTGYYITSAAQHLGLTLDIQSQMLTAPLLPQDDLNREREVIVEEINMYEDQPMSKANDEFENLMYGGSSMGRMIIGTKETVRSTTSQDLRQYMNRWYRGSNMMIVIAGKFSNPKFSNSQMTTEVTEALNNFKFDSAMAIIWARIKKADQYVSEKRVWELKDKEREDALSFLVSEIRQIATDLAPFLPESAQKIAEIYNKEKIVKGEGLFPRLG